MAATRGTSMMLLTLREESSKLWPPKQQSLQPRSMIAPGEACEYQRRKFDPVSVSLSCLSQYVAYPSHEKYQTWKMLNSPSSSPWEISSSCSFINFYAVCSLGAVYRYLINSAINQRQLLYWDTSSACVVRWADVPEEKVSSRWSRSLKHAVREKWVPKEELNHAIHVQLYYALR